jgi:hypothetical protein
MRRDPTCAARSTRPADGRAGRGLSGHWPRPGWRRAGSRGGSPRSAPTAAYPDDPLGKLVCEEALAAAAAGNYGVGALLADASRRGDPARRQPVFSPRFASDGHAEMALVSRLEREHPELVRPRS